MPFIICCIQETLLGHKNIHRLKVEGWEKFFHANGNQTRTGWPDLYQTKLTISQNRIYHKRQRRTLCNDKKVNLPGKHNNEDIVRTIRAPKYYSIVTRKKPLIQATTHINPQKITLSLIT